MNELRHFGSDCRPRPEQNAGVLHDLGVEVGDGDDLAKGSHVQLALRLLALRVASERQRRGVISKP